MTSLVNISENAHYDCIKLDIDSEYFTYNEDLKIVDENFEKLNEMHIDFDFYIITISDRNSKLITDMKNTSTIIFNLSEKVIAADRFIGDYIEFQYLMKPMSLEDYLNLNKPEISNKYEGKYIIIHDELPHLHNLQYIRDLVGYEVDCVHLNANSEYFGYSNFQNELFELDLIYDVRRRILSYILDIDESFKNSNPELNIDCGNKLRYINVIKS